MILADGEVVLRVEEKRRLLLLLLLLLRHSADFNKPSSSGFKCDVEERQHKSTLLSCITEALSSISIT